YFTAAEGDLRVALRGRGRGGGEIAAQRLQRQPLHLAGDRQIQVSALHVLGDRRGLLEQRLRVRQRCAALLGARASGDQGGADAQGGEDSEKTATAGLHSLHRRGCP